MAFNKLVMKRIYCLLCLVLCWVGLLQAKIVLPGYFSDNMVLQQNSIVKVYGLSSKKAGTVEIRTGWSDDIFRADVNENGHWFFELQTPKAGGPYDIIFSDGDECFLHNVLIGEVWLCSGQSNMEMPVSGWGKVMNYEAELAMANNSSIRLFQVQKNTSLVPQTDLRSTMGEWKECTSESLANFSALGYFFARNLWRKLDVPIGIIDCTWGGTPIEGWSSYEAMSNIPNYSCKVKEVKKLNFDRESLRKKYESDRKIWQDLLTSSDKGCLNGTYRWTGVDLNEEEWSEVRLPNYFEKSIIGGFDGIMWLRKIIELPQSWEKQNLTLRLGKIDDEDITFFNGVEIARGYGYNTSREYVIPSDLVRIGKNVIVIKVSDFGGEGGVYGKEEDLVLMNEKGDYIPLSGNWKYKEGVSLKELPGPPLSPVDNASFPASIYNAMVNPLTSFPIKGVIWYQGEANVGNADLYADMFQELIQDWRVKWRNMEMPFYFVQLANYMERKEVQPESEWAALREAQNKALHVAFTGMAITIDIGEADDIHPKNKQEVGRRLAALALNRTYGKKQEDQSLRYSGYRIENDKIRLFFSGSHKRKDAFKGLPTGFVIAGTNHVFYKAEAEIQGDEILVWSPEVKHPVAVRYGWADNPDCNLYDVNGFPIAPFRTDNWQ